MRLWLIPMLTQGAYTVAPLFRVSVSYIYEVLGRRRATEETARPNRAGRKPKRAGHDEALRGQVAAHPDATLEELQAWLASERRARAPR